ncbi:exported hypothetical protein [Rhodospirillaceae bacterium LM-1]|nr:exported hypothetical protein [Rhodospirillaceae bacterium LM-1]
MKAGNKLFALFVVAFGILFFSNSAEATLMKVIKEALEALLTHKPHLPDKPYTPLPHSAPHTDNYPKFEGPDNASPGPYPYFVSRGAKFVEEKFLKSCEEVKLVVPGDMVSVEGASQIAVRSCPRSTCQLVKTLSPGAYVLTVISVVEPKKGECWINVSETGQADPGFIMHGSMSISLLTQFSDTAEGQTLKKRLPFRDKLLGKENSFGQEFYQFSDKASAPSTSKNEK